MRTTRHKITLLKNKISDTLPDDNDILGYNGISKHIIIESLAQSYELLAVLEGYNDKFETIFAKRTVAELIDHSNSYLNENWNTDSANEKFNDFLKNISGIRFTLKEAYLSLNNSPLRLENEIVTAKEKLKELTGGLESIETTKTEIELIKSESKELIADLEKKHILSIENEKKINEFSQNVELIDEDLKGTSEKINLWKTEIQSIRDDISKKQTELSTIKSEIEEVQESNSLNNETIEGFIETLKDQITINKKHQDYIQKTIEDVSRAGMAGSFKKRKDELKWIQLVWAVFTILSISGLLYISFTIVEPFISNHEYDLNQLFFKLPIIASAVWLGWFCAKQYGFTSRIIEDYSFKYAVSMAFEGYRKDAKEIDESLLQKLLGLTIINISKSPVSNFDSKSNHGTPYNELIESFMKTFFKRNQTEE
jgi:predicted  nucleic acid-binding Zn-ribbon protein